MDVILSEDIEKLGKLGDVVKVKDGFARNFLLPQRKACLATAVNLKKIEQQKKKQLEAYNKEKEAAQTLAERIGKVSCTINVEVNDLEKLYGSVSELDIVRVLGDEGFKIEKNNIIIEKPIEQLGIFEVGVKLHPEVTAKLRVWVTKK